MKNYIKNKHFVTNEFIAKVENIKLKRRRNILIILLCLNLIYLPLNLNILNKSSNQHVEKINIESYSKEKKFKSDDICKISEVLLSDNIKEYDVTSDGGSIVVSSVEETDNILNKKAFEVEEVELKNDGNFELKVSSDEEHMY